MAKGDRVTRVAYNTLQASVANIVGIGSDQVGYGQQVLSRQANVGEVVSAALVSHLRTDMAKAWAHQTNTVVVDNFEIGPPNLKLYQSGDVLRDFITQYNDFVNNATTGILARRNLANINQLTSGVEITSTTRTASWGGLTDVISHTVTVTFNGYTQGTLSVSPNNHARVFFNAGGSIQISASRTGGTGSTKDTTWTNLLSGFGVLSFRGSSSSITGTLNSGGSLASSTGFFGLIVGAAPTTILIQPGPAGVYAENDYVVQVSRPTSNTIAFTITFRDDDAGDQTGTGAAVDEEVTGTLTSLIRCTRPSGSNVDVPSPTGTSTTL